jgi:DNA (cytosine-5)-methyltransferase 1
MKDNFYRDPRRRLFEQYLFFLKTLEPKVFVFENVPGIITAQLKRRNVVDLLQEGLDQAGYVIARPSAATLSEDPHDYMLNSAEFGIPQRRKRLIIIGLRKEFAKRNTHMMNIYAELQKQTTNNKDLTVQEAIADLPDIRPGEGNDRWFGPYEQKKEVSTYAAQLRDESEGVLNYRARTHMQSDLERYRYFLQHHANGNSRANLKKLLTERPALAPAHKNLTSFLDRFKVQWWDRPASTITSHLSKDGHYYIHPDVRQCRSFTAREAARCQSFPDNYLFEGPRTEQFRQVGNAVPPILANAIAKSIMKQLRNL